MVPAMTTDDLTALEQRAWTVSYIFDANPPEGSPQTFYALKRGNVAMTLDPASATYAADLAALLAEPLPPPTPAQLAAIPAQMAAQDLAATFTSTDEVAAVAKQLRVAAKAGIANFKADLAAWPTLTDAQKLSHVEGLMQSMVGVLQHLTGDYS